MPTSCLRWNLIITDGGFLIYWAVSALGLLPASWLYKDYADPVMVAWNWSFAPIDLTASIAGLAALQAARKGSAAWRPLALVSAALTCCAGLMALSFWALRGDFDPAWWAPNLYLALWPVMVWRELSARTA